MSKPSIIALTDRALLQVSGADAHDFLQGLLSVDVERTAAGGAVYAALLTPQGKVLFDLFVLARDGAFLIDCAAARADELAKRLGFYKLRAAVEIEPADDGLEVFAILGETPDLPALPEPGMAARIDDMLLMRDPRTAEAGLRLIARTPQAQDLAATHGLAEAGAGLYDARRIALGLPDGARDIGPGEFFAHECDLDQLHGVDFKKGCFVGQEVVSRMQHRGTARNRMVPVRLSEPVPAEIRELHAGEKTVGALLSRHETGAIALVRLDRAAAALDAGTPITAGAATVTLIQPPWAGFTVPGTEAAA